MRNFELQNKSRTLGIVFECIILCLIPLAHSIPMIFSHDRQNYFEARKIFTLTGCAIFASNSVAHLMLFFLKNKKRVLTFQVILRVLTWTLLVINMIENQVVYFSTSEGLKRFSEISPQSTITCTWIGAYTYAFINLWSIENYMVRKFLTCATILYSSLRISINSKDPTAAVMGGALCLILYKFLHTIQKEIGNDPERESAKDKEIFLLKTFLAESDEGCIMLQNNKKVFYANSNAFDLLENHGENILSSLERLKRFDALSKDDRYTLKEKMFDPLIEKEDDAQSQHKAPQFFSIHPSNARGFRLESSPRDSINANNHSVEIKENILFQKHEKSFFSSIPKNKSQSIYTMNSNKFRPSSPTTAGPTQSITRAGLFAKLKTLPLSRMIKTIDHDSKSNLENLSVDNLEDQPNRVFFYRPSLSKKDGQDSPDRSHEPQEEYLIKDGIPNDLHKLFQVLGMFNVPSIEFPYTVDQLANAFIRKPTKSFSEYTCYLELDENNVKFFETKFQSIIVNKEPFLLIRLKDASQKEFCNFLKASEKGRTSMLASVSHELRTPLNCIVTMLDMVEKFISDDLKEDYIQPAADSAKLLLSLIHDILDFSQSKAKGLRLNFSFFNLKQHLMDIIKLMSLQAKGKGLELNLYYDERVPFKIYSDPNRVRQIVINLIGNALKFTTKGGVTIRVTYCEANVSKISVVDTGVGIKPNNIKSLFKKFSKVAETHRMNQQGVGLGLVISNMLAKKLGNKSITVESRYGSGTTFSFELESKIHLAQSKEFDNGLSSDEEDLGLNVMDNINGMKEKNKRAEIQKMKLFERRPSYILQRPVGSRNNSFMKRTSLRKASILNYSLQMAHFHSRDDAKEGECSSPYLRESPPIINLYTPTPKAGFRDNLDVNPNIPIPRLSLSLSVDDKTSSFGLKSPSKNRNVFEEEGFAKHMDERAKLVHKLSYKLNLLSADDPFILIVDDNAFNIIALTKILEGLNMRTDSATSGDLAIQKILERQNKSDKQTYKVIFMDCSMPVKDGYVVTREIRDLQEKGVIPKIQIVAVTASNYPSDIKRCFDSGMDDYLTKPVSLDLMKNILAKHIANDN